MLLWKTFKTILILKLKRKPGKRRLVTSNSFILQIYRFFDISLTLRIESNKKSDFLKTSQNYYSKTNLCQQFISWLLICLSSILDFIGHYDLQRLDSFIVTRWASLSPLFSCYSRRFVVASFTFSVKFISKWPVISCNSRNLNPQGTNFAFCLSIAQSCPYSVS